MGNPRPKPHRLAEKLLAIRKRLELSQLHLAQHLELPAHGDYRISEYETGRREPSLMLLLRYARAANVSVECLIDDEMDLPL